MLGNRREASEINDLLQTTGRPFVPEIAAIRPPSPKQLHAGFSSTSTRHARRPAEELHWISRGIAAARLIYSPASFLINSRPVFLWPARSTNERNLRLRIASILNEKQLPCTSQERAFPPNYPSLDIANAEEEHYVCYVFTWYSYASAL